MPMMSVVVSIAANTRSANLFAGQAFEFAASPSIVRLYGRSAAIGLNIDFLLGGESLIADSEIAALAGFPTRPDDLLTEHGANAGERIFVTASNTTGAPIIVQLLCDVIPL